MSGPRQQPRLFGAIAKQQLVPYLVGHGVAYSLSKAVKQFLKSAVLIFRHALRGFGCGW